MEHSVFLKAFDKNGVPRRIVCTTDGIVQALSRGPAPGIVIESTAYEAKKIVSGSPCVIYYARAFSLLGGFVVLVNKATDPATNDIAKASCIWPIAAGQTIVLDLSPTGERFTTGCGIAFCSSVSLGTGTAEITVGANGALFTVEGDLL